MLGIGLRALGPRRGRQFNATFGAVGIERITIGGPFPDQILKSGIDKDDLMRRSTGYVDGDRTAGAVCHGHDLGTVAPHGLFSTAPPFWDHHMGTTTIWVPMI
jgi:hypothetical protein